MRIFTTPRPRRASWLGSLGQGSSIQERDLPALRGKFVKLRPGSAPGKGDKLIKIGHVNLRSDYYVFAKPEDLGDSFVIGVAWGVPKGSDPVKFYPVKTLIPEYELVSPAEEAQIVDRDPIPEFNVKRTSLQNFYEAATKAYELAEQALSLADSGRFEEAQAVLATRKTTPSPGPTGAFAERDKAILELHILEDIGVFTVAEAAGIKASVIDPLVDILNQAGLAISERKGFFSQLFQSVKNLIKSVATKIASTNDEKWKSFLAFYRALTELEQTATRNIAELRASPLSEAGRAEVEKIEQNVIKLRLAKARVEQVSAKNGVDLANLRSQAGLGQIETGTLIITAIVFTVVGLIISALAEPLLALIRDLFVGREGKIKAYEEEFRIQAEAQGRLEKEQSAARQQQLKFENTKIEEVQQKGRNLIDSLSNLTGESVTLEKLEKARKLTPAGKGSQSGAGLSPIQWVLLSAGGGLLLAYLVSTYLVGKKTE